MKNAIGRFIRGMLDRLASSFYEGPEPPPRLRDGVLIFRAMNPNATVVDWVEFASSTADDAYRAGFVRGMEWRERGLAELDPMSEQRLADEAANAWSVADGNPELRALLDAGADPSDPLAGVPPDARAEFFDLVGRLYGTHRVVIVDDDGDPIEPSSGGTDSA